MKSASSSALDDRLPPCAGTGQQIIQQAHGKLSRSILLPTAADPCSLSPHASSASASRSPILKSYEQARRQMLPEAVTVG